MKKGCFSIVLLLLISWAVGTSAIAQKSEPPKAEPTVEMKVAADVAGEKIMERDLGEECLKLHGAEELKDIVKKFLIQLECKRLNITITQQEVNEEIERMAKTFKFSTKDWLELLEKERGVTPEQYMSDIIWPILAIGKIGGARMQVSDAEIQREYDKRFGPAVQVRQILLYSRADAEKVLAEVQANPDSFATVAKHKSQDPASQPYGGLLQPIRRHLLPPNVDQTVFALKPGEISPVVELSIGQFLIFRCEQHLAPQNVDIAKVRDQLATKVKDVKTREIAEEVFSTLQSQAKIDIVFGDSAKMSQYPGVAAIVNGQTISLEYLQGRCFKQYAKTVLSEMISKKIIDIACRKAEPPIVLTDADIDNEIREMAMLHVPLRQDGSPNVELWLKLALQDGKTPYHVYRSNTIAPMLALKRLTRNIAQVTEEDLQRSFEANYGPKVRCLAIALDGKDQRRALEVWELANRNRTAENFGDLAEKYSSETETRVGRGTIPPIGKHCGQPRLEEEAFSLKPGEISQIIQVDESLVILFCLGIEQPTITDINDVKQELVADIFTKKQKLAIAKYFEKLQANTAVDNYLTGESRNPEVEEAMQKEASPAAKPVRR